MNFSMKEDDNRTFIFAIMHIKSWPDNEAVNVSLCLQTVCLLYQGELKCRFSAQSVCFVCLI